MTGASLFFLLTKFNVMKKIIEKIKFTSFDDEEKIVNVEDKLNLGVTKDKFNNRIRDIKNDKIKKSLMELTKIFREK